MANSPLKKDATTPLSSSAERKQWQEHCPGRELQDASRRLRHVLRRGCVWLAVVGVIALMFTPASAQETPNQPAALKADGGLASGFAAGPRQWTSPEGLSSALQVMLMLTVVTMAPAIILMTTSFVRVIIVLGLLRQALGTQQLPPSQVITSLALFISLVVMTPVWTQVYDNAIEPYTNPDVEMSLEQAWVAGAKPVRRFMADQIMRTENDDDVIMFLRYLPEASQTDPQTGKPVEYVYYSTEPGDVEVPLQALLPGFMLSELKTAFLIGFQIYLPFLILDIVVSSITISMGMLMLPPVLISLPFKILLFVLLDGWHLVVQMLLDSFQTFT